jgi:uncharacterized protein CbrC (UPF0167 family)
MPFKYFKDPKKYSFSHKEKVNCTICDKKTFCYNAGSYCGDEDIEAICDKCLKDGKLIKLGITTNDVNLDQIKLKIIDKNKLIELANEIIYKTPKLPTWQACFWPFVDDDFCVFEKIASKQDYDNKEEFTLSFSKEDRESSDMDALWASLPEQKITSLHDGNYDCSVYLFSKDNKKISLWDSN